MIQAVIFDMDGLLIDSEPFWEEAEIQIFNAIGLPFTMEMCAETTGTPITEIVKLRHRQFQWDATRYPIDVVAEQILNRVIDKVNSSGVPMPGVPYVIESFLQRGFRVALASSSPSRLIDATLSRLGIASLFEVIQSAEKLAFGKPHPLVFLECARRLRLSSAECLVFEDSPNGVIAAKAAGMTCIAIPDKKRLHSSSFLNADAVLPSLSHFDFHFLARDTA
ncbi:MAG: hexitol phosphatase HxpB [Deltaproteobacteria bacterium]|nr:hexitol phosphatase HxpB [Deltaproteobacteria bacterium]